MRHWLLLFQLSAGFVFIQPAHAHSVDTLMQTVQQLQTENASLKSDLEKLAAENRRLRVLAGLVEPEDRAMVQERKLETQTDEAGRVTRATSNPTAMVITGGTRADHEIHLRFDNDQPILEIRGFYSRGIYRNVRDMELLLDGQPLTLAISSYRSKRQDFGTRVNISADDEFITIHLSRDELAKVGKAASVTGKLGRTTFNLTQDQIALFRALNARLGS